MKRGKPQLTRVVWADSCHSEQVVNQVLDELGLSVEGQLADTPTTGATVPAETVSADADLQVLSPHYNDRLC